MVAFTLGLSVISLNGYTQQKVSPYSNETYDALGLSSEQRKATKQMLDRFVPRIKELRAQQSTMPDYEYKAKWGRLMAERADEYAKILTPEQKKQLDELIAASKRSSKPKAEPQKNVAQQKSKSTAPRKLLDPYSDETFNTLGLTPEQRKATKKMLDGFKPRIKEIRAQQSSMPANEYNAKWRQLMAERADEYAKILTPEQKKQLDELSAEARKNR